MKRASEKDTNTNEVKKIAYNKLHIAPQHHEGTTKNYLFFTLDQREDNGFLNYPLDKIALKDEHEQIIGKQDASKIFTIDNKDDNARLKDALTKFGTPLNGVQLGGKRKRKTRKSKRPRKSKKSKRKTNRKKI